MNDETTSQPADENEHTDELRHEPPQPTTSPKTDRRELPSLWPGITALGVGIGIAIAIQSVAQEIDYQRANIFSTLAVLIGSMFLIYRVQRRLAIGEHAWYLLPSILIGIVAAGCVAFRFEGFSGEMSPQFSWRFGSTSVRELQEVKSAALPAGIDDSTETRSDSTIPTSETERVSSLQFLGDNRNGVQPKRSFAIPKSADAVERLWDIGIGEGWSSFAIDQGLAVTIEQRDDVECLTCYRLTDGELVWIQRHTARHQNLLGGIGPRSTPTIDAGRVFATSGTGFLWCVDLQSGGVRWTADLLRLAGWDQATFEAAASWGYAISPLVTNGLCIVSLGGPDDGLKPPPSLVALDAESGVERWRGGSDQLSYASPVVATLGGQRQIVSVNEKTVSGHAIEDGKQLWSFDWFGQTNGGATCSSAMPVGDSQLLLGKGYGGGSALVKVTHAKDWNAEAVWTSQRVLQTKFNHTCVDGNIGYGIGNGALQAVDLSDPPKRLWIQPRRSRAGQGQAILCEDTLVVQDEGGDVVLVAADTTQYKELLRLKTLDSKTWNIPTVAGSYLLVRNDRQAICFKLPTR
ncbi:MAG: PQQ-binding-like beta-propeller repeat protein [Planctomycetota bacterium]